MARSRRPSRFAPLLLAAALLLLAAAAPRGADANGVPLNGDPSKVLPAARASAPNPCIDPADGSALDAVQVPDAADANRYFVCCGGRAVHYACRVPSQSAWPYVLYSDATANNSYYSPVTGACERTPGGTTTAGLTAAGGAGGPVGNGTTPSARAGKEAVTPVSTEWADEVCGAVRRYLSGDDGGANAAPPTAAGGAAGLLQALLGGGSGNGNGAANAPGRGVRASNGNGKGGANGKYPRASRTSSRLRSSTAVGANATAAALRQAPLAGGPDVTGQWQLLTGPNGQSNTGIVAMHATLVPGGDKVLVWARRLPDGVAYPEGMSPNGQGEVGALFDTATGTYTVAPMRPAPFCTGQSHDAAGTVIAAGGDADVGGYLGDGLRSVRLWRREGDAWEVAPVTLGAQHWYPTQLLLGDGARTLIVGGYTNGEQGIPSPAIEVYNSFTNELRTLYDVPVLVELGGYNLYPVVAQLPWAAPGVEEGSFVIVVFGGTAGQVMFVNPAGDVNSLQRLPPWPTPGFTGAFSAAGGHTLLRLEPEAGYAAELVMFGGAGAGGGACTCDVGASDKAHRVKLDQAAVLGGAMAWEVEGMPGPRVMVDATLLPDGKVVLVNGAQSGTSNGGGPGGGGQARGAEGAAWLYDPKAPNGARFSVLAASGIKRLYHSTALLLPSGDLLVMGSEQNDCFEACVQFNPALHQFQAELFKLPYAFSPARPTITGQSAQAVAMGDQVTVDYEGAVDGAVLVAPGAVTHQVNMNQRAIKLEVAANAAGAVTLNMPPPGGAVAPPGWYMLFLMNGNIPCTKAAWVQLTL